MKLSNIKHWFFKIVFLIVLPNAMLSQDVYLVETRYPVHDINSSLQVVLDHDESLTPEKVLNDTSLSYTSGDQLGRYLEIGETYWGKVRINASDSLLGWTLHLQDYLIGTPAWTKSNGKVDVFAFVDHELLFHKKTGVEYPRADRDIKENWVLNRVRLDEIPTDKVITLILRVEGNDIGYPPSFRLSLRSPSQPYYHEIYQFNNSFNLFMLGVTFIIFLYHFLMYIYTRQKIFLDFTIWMFFCVMTMAMSVGIFIGSFTIYRFSIWMIIANGVVYSFWFFGRSFINAKENFPKLDRVILLLALLIIAEIFITALYVIIVDPVTSFTGVGIHYLLLISYSLTGCLISVYLICQKDQFARYFGLGALIGCFAYVVGGLWSIGIYRPPIDPYAWSMFLQIVIFSFGIAYRQRRITLQLHKDKLLAQESFDEVQRMKDLSEVKTRFFANVSHEFRTPLSLITGPIEHAAKSVDLSDDPGRPIELSAKTYSIIKKNAERLRILVDQLLDISKIENGQNQLTLTQGALVKFIKSIVGSFESMAERKNVSLNSSFPEECHTAFYDKDKLEKIISNLLSNAFKYTPEGGMVSVGMDIDESYFTIEIGDSGHGIKKNELTRIFERFYRVAGSEVAGSGIGLALTKNLVDLQNGQISVSSTVGKGTRFKIRMPITLSDFPDLASVYLNQKKEKFSNNKGERIDPIHLDDNQVLELSNGRDALPVALIVEDNKDLQEFIKTILSSSYKPITAVDGLQGERMAFEYVPDIIISDIMMPGKDGYELCNALKSNVKTSHIPIIMLTAKAGHSNKLEGLTVGADAFLTKPFDEEELLIRMRNLLEARHKYWEHFKSLDLSITPDLNLASAEDKFMQQIIETIRKNIDNEKLSVEDLGRALGFSRSQLHRKLKALTNKSANQLIVEIRLSEAYRMLEHSAGSVSEVAYSVGYSNMSYFTKSFKNHFGTLPSKVDKKRS